SVTVSMAALTSGVLSRMFLVRKVLTSTCVGRTSECCGTSSTSSNVNAVAKPASSDSNATLPVLSSILQPGGVLTCTTCPQHPPCLPQWSRRRPVTLLVLLAAAARTRLVPPDLGFLTSYGLGSRIVPANARRLLGPTR